MALGAKSADVFRIVMSSTAGNVGGGLAVGLLLSIAFRQARHKVGGWRLRATPHPGWGNAVAPRRSGSGLFRSSPRRGVRRSQGGAAALSEPQRRMKVAVSSRASIFSEIGDFFRSR